MFGDFRKLLGDSGNMFGDFRMFSDMFGDFRELFEVIFVLFRKLSEFAA